MEHRIDSPELPARPLAAIDDIFAAAVLPEDHPHALKFLERKAETDHDIVQSPSITSKIKLQFRRSSLKNLNKGQEYDGDARQMTLKEVLDDVAHTEDEREQRAQIGHGPPSTRVTLASDANETVSKPLGFASTPSNQNGSLLHSPGHSELGIPEEFHNAEETAAPSASHPNILGTASTRRTPSSVLSQLPSSPMLLYATSGEKAPLQRSCSESALRHVSWGPKVRIGLHSNCSPIPEKALETDVTAVIPLHNHEATTAAGTDAKEPETNGMHIQEKTLPVRDEISLHEMGISAQLRSMSQMSELSAEEPIFTAAQPLSFHRRETSDFSGSSGGAGLVEPKPRFGMDGTVAALTSARVRTPARDTASSIYSRSASARVNAHEHDYEVDKIPSPSAPLDLNSLVADWPLKRTACLSQAEDIFEKPSYTSGLDEQSHKPVRSTTDQSHGKSRQWSFEYSANNADCDSARLLPRPRQDASIPSKSSSSTMTKISVTSKFLERLSPLKKTVTKRRSIFKFLRPGSRKQQSRSISSPILHGMTPKPASPYDGPSDDPALLTIQYELTDQSHHTRRSPSMNQLDLPTHQDTVAHFTSSQDTLQRQPTLVEYERSLSVVGDNRRRPSTVNIETVKAIQEEDRRESIGLRRRLSRARPLRDDANPLMTQALEKHQQEKALFRSCSKHREAGGEVHATSLFSPSVFDRAGTSLPPASLKDHNDLLDPLEKGHLKSPSERGLDDRYLLPPAAQSSNQSQSTSSATSAKASSATMSSINPTSSSIHEPKKRIGTNLASWSRYPSHTRAERCGSAGHADAVLTRDFAVDINPEEIHGDDENGVDSPPGKRLGKRAAPRGTLSLPKSRSSTFSGIVRYYSNLFHTKGWYGQNRRSSIATAGQLEYPELEMLPPQMATAPLHHHGAAHTLHDFKEHVKEDVGKVKAFVKDEEAKLERYVKKEEHELADFLKKEEGKLEEFVKKEEHKFAGFVKKEEGKFRDFVKDEEAKVLHHRRHASSDYSHSSKNSVFRTDSIWTAPSHQNPDRPLRGETMIRPDELVADSPHDYSTNDRIFLDGTVTGRNEDLKSAVSKADLLSSEYKDCILRPLSTDRGPDMTSKVQPSRQEAPRGLPIPALKPIKPRTPDKPKALDPKATIRRFPSVTVVDDRKGHIRSVSLISAKTTRSAAFERSSTQDLLEQIRARELQEREKLLKGFNSLKQAEIENDG